MSIVVLLRVVSLTRGASAVVGIWAAFDQADVGETVKPLGHPPEESSIVCTSWVGFSA